ncbi:MAG TPA: ATP-binding protein, partial [Kofleriaceae bacterium]|nr:ATP-binding protein [Kofleriaceae bacterium]
RARSFSLKPGMMPAFPGATFAIGSDGNIVTAWLGPASPVATAEGDFLAALDVDDASPDASRVQLLLACACGAIATAWPMFAVDAPTVLICRNGSALALLWQPVVIGGRIDSVAAFVIAGEALRVEPDDPIERNRICVDALGLLDECDGSLRHFRAEPEARHAVHRMFRAVHTIKGSTRGSRLRSVHQLAHEVEETLDVFRRSEEPAPADALDLLERELVRLRAEITAARPRGEVDDAMTELSSECRPAIADLRSVRAGILRGADDAIVIARRSIARLEAAADRANMRALRVQCSASRNALDMMADGGFDPDLVVEIDALDRQVELYQAVYREVAATDAGPSTLVALARWLDAPEDRSGLYDGISDVVAKAGLPALVAAFTDPDPYATRRALAVLTDGPAMFEPARPRDDASLRFERAQRDLLTALDRLALKAPAASLAEARAIVQRLVWTPLGVIARRLVRMTRTLGADLGKNVVAEIDLGDLLVAPEIGRVIGEILIHAVRNAADHGIEAPGDRTDAGKDPAGVIRVEARAVHDRVQVVVSDDGRGIDVAKVRRAAVSRGLLGSDAIYSEAEILEVLFTPGFSTASAVTAVSGRGVGMDVIKCLAEEQGGTVVLSSVAGRGTRLVLDLPFAPP